MHRLDMNKSQNQEVYTIICHGSKMHLPWSPFVPFIDHNDRFSYPFIYLKMEKGSPFAQSFNA